jgi:5-methylthioadenosine/S-adenosylhomocysteine deaminase
MSVLIRNALVLTMNDRLDVVHGAVSVRDGRIVAVGAEPAHTAHDTVIDAHGAVLLPGFVQTHIHLCQTLFRGYADDLRLLDWLRTRIWPLEAAHTPATLAAAARLACLELLTSGTTAILTMETVHDTDAVFEAVAATGMRATIGKAMMDAPLDGVPPRLVEPTAASFEESLALRRQYHGTHNGRIRMAFAPRFALSCTRGLLEAVAAASAEERIVVHSHASEQTDEVALVREVTGQGNIQFFETIGLATPYLSLAHCVWVDADDRSRLAARGVKVTHCPGSNLKLGSGVAPVPEMLDAGICVSLGSDGAACNNHLDMFGEMRLAATLQAARLRPGALPARRALWMATRNGARALGLEDEIGSIEAGKRADLILVDTGAAHLQPSPDPFSAIVYAARPNDVRLTMVDGHVLVQDGRPVHMDSAAVAATAREAAAGVLRRAGL